MFLWNTPIGQKTFNLTPEFAKASAALAANQGLYNGFLAAGLIWALYAKRDDLKVFFLTCVFIAGIFGAATASITILYVQAMPAFVALIMVLLAGRLGATIT
ncbi:MAG: DUF1304 domain-containing protein [Kordiimonadaceae bacterium]|nr:DUF1304 domain-containing protein [Kordiimonadaceae bacterium]